MTLNQPQSSIIALSANRTLTLALSQSVQTGAASAKLTRVTLPNQRPLSLDVKLNKSSPSRV